MVGNGEGKKRASVMANFRGLSFSYFFILMELKERDSFNNLNT